MNKEAIFSFPLRSGKIHILRERGSLLSSMLCGASRFTSDSKEYKAKQLHSENLRLKCPRIKKRQDEEAGDE